MITTQTNHIPATKATPARAGRTVLVAIRFDRGLDDLLAEGHRWARSLGAHLRVCHVVPDAPPKVHPLFPGFDSRTLSPGTLRNMIESEIRSRVEKLPGRDAGTFDVDVLEGDPAEEIAQLARETDADAVMIGGERRGLLSRMLAPGVARALARTLDCPLAVVRPGGDPRRHLVGTDLQDAGHPVLSVAAQIGRLLRGRVTALHAVSPVIAADPFGATIAFAGSAEWDAHRRLERAVREVDPDIRPVVLAGAAPRAILDEAARTRAGLVVVGHHTRTGLGRVFEGSVSEEILASSPCSVLVVPLGWRAA